MGGGIYFWELAADEIAVGDGYHAAGKEPETKFQIFERTVRNDAVCERVAATYI